MMIRKGNTELAENVEHGRVSKRSIGSSARWAAGALGLLLAAEVCLTGCGNGSTSSGGESGGNDGTAIKFTNVSYDPTREFYEIYDELFEKYYFEKTGVELSCTTTHGGSGSQARSVIEGCDADVVTLALAHDITLIENQGLIEPGWIEEFDRNSAPYTSTIVFLVRSGNKKNIQDWDDLTGEKVDIITPDPKSSGGACWNFLAAWYYAEKAYDGDEEQMKEFMRAIYQNVVVMDSGARGATTTFVENKQGDVLLAWENEALLTLAEYPDEYEIVFPSVSIKAEPSVAIVDANAESNGTEEIAAEYLNYLYSDEAQRLAAENYYRPTNEEILQEYADRFDTTMDLCTVDDFGGWDAVYEKFFVDDAVFDEIYYE